jgi:PAS domain S-box-containing protein
LKQRQLARVRWPRFESDARHVVNQQMALRFLHAGAAITLVGALISAFEPFDISLQARVAMVVSQLLMTAGCLLGTRLVDRQPPERLVVAGAWVSVATATIVSLAIGHGAHALDLAFYPIVVCVVAALVGTRAALIMALGCAAIVVALAWAETQGWIAGARVLGNSPLSHPLTTHALLIAAGFTVGAIMLRLSNASYRVARDREDKFHGLLAVAVQQYWELDAELRLVKCDDATTLTPSTLLAVHMGQRFDEVVRVLAGADASGPQALQALAAREPFRHLLLRVPLAGGLRHLQLSGRPRRDARGRFVGYWGVIEDLSAQVHQQAESRRMATTLAATFEAVPDCLAVTDLATGRFRMVNPEFSRIFGYTSDEAVGRTSIELGTWAHADDRHELTAALRQHGRVTGQRYLFRTRGGETILMRVSAAVTQLGDGDAIVMTARDITADERTRQQYAAVLRHASIGIAFTRDRRIVNANPYFERMFGWPPGGTIGHGAEVMGANDEQCDALERDFAAKAAQGQSQVIETPMTRRDGTRFWCRLQADVVGGDDPAGRGTIWIAEDITERKAAERELAAARDAAEAASRAKSQFLANTSHEIRTPLNGLLGMARLALDDDVTHAQRKRYLQHILESAQGLSAIMSDILDLSKIEAGKLDLDAAPFHLRDALEAVRHVNLPLAEAKGLAIALEIDSALPATVQGDAMRVRQIVGNFVSNAIKFTERGLVHIEARPLAGGRVRLAVHDSGIGIAPEVQGRLFAPFSQADQSTTRRYGGTGLGLSICRELAQLLGGQVGLASTPGQGSSFWVELPLPATEAAPAEARAAETAVDAAALHGARVLVAEDNAVNMMITVALLEQWGVEVVQATDGAQARDAVIAAARAGRPFDAVLMDVQMPEQSGHEAADALRRQLGEARPPVIALTAAAMVSEREQALASGMCDFLTKPVEATRMQHTLARWVRRSRSPAGS